MQTSNVSKDEDHRLFVAKIRLDLRSVGGNGGDVCNVVAFLERWDRVDVQDDTGDGSAGFEYELAEIVGDKADFHAFLNIGTALHKRVPMPGPSDKTSTTLSSQTGFSMGRGFPESILRARMVLNVPSTRRSTSSASTMPA